LSLRAPDSPAPAASAGAPAGVDPAILRSIRQASQATDIDFGYLVAEAGQESGFQPRAAAPGSTARGLFQFIESTWLEMVRRYGAQYGAGQYAQQIGTDSGGRASVADPKLRRQILDLRDDPKLSASLAAEYARSNKTELESALGQPVSNTDLYLAHFLGAGGATSFLKNMRQDASASAPALFPEAAAANRSVFYDRKTGMARRLADVYRVFAAKIDPQSNAFARVMEAGSSATAQARAMPLAQPRGPMPLKPRGSGPLLAMFNTMAVTAMKAMGEVRFVRPAAFGGIDAAPAAPAASAHRSARQPADRQAADQVA